MYQVFFNILRPLKPPKLYTILGNWCHSCVKEFECIKKCFFAFLINFFAFNIFIALSFLFLFLQERFILITMKFNLFHACLFNINVYRYQRCISYLCERNMYFYTVVFSKSIFCKYFHVRSNLGLIGYEYFLGRNSLC